MTGEFRIRAYNDGATDDRTLDVTRWSKTVDAGVKLYPLKTLQYFTLFDEGAFPVLAIDFGERIEKWVLDGALWADPAIYPDPKAGFEDVELAFIDLESFLRRRCWDWPKCYMKMGTISPADEPAYSSRWGLSDGNTNGWEVLINNCMYTWVVETPYMITYNIEVISALKFTGLFD